MGYIELGSGDITLLTYVAIALFLILGGLLWATWQGWAYTAYVLVIALTLLVGGFVDEPYLTQQVSIGLFIPAIVALVLIDNASP